MAKLILTKEERETDSYFDWPDESIGKAVRQLALKMTHKKGKKGELYALFLATCLKVWGTVMRECNAADMKTSSVLSGPKWEGQWRIEVKSSLKKVRSKEPKKRGPQKCWRCGHPMKNHWNDAEHTVRGASCRVPGCACAGLSLRAWGEV